MAAILPKPLSLMAAPLRGEELASRAQTLTQHIAIASAAHYLVSMRPVLLLLVASASLVACGGGDPGSPDTGRLGNNTITVQASVWHAWASVYDPNNPEGCPDLLAPGEFAATPGPFPADVTIPLVEVYRDGTLLWSGPVRSDFGLLNNGNLHAVAAACGLKPLPPAGTPLTVRFVMTGGGEMTSIVTSPLPLAFVY